MMERDERFDKANKVIWIGFWVNVSLMAFKLAAGHWGGSDAVFADGIESACDSVAIISTMMALRLGRKPSDEQHPYGHGRAESLSALLVGLLILLTGIWILWDAIEVITQRQYKAPGWIAVLAAVMTIVVKELLYRYTDRTAEALSSPALQATAKDHRKDALTSIATVVGVIGAYAGFGIMDPLAAGLTSFFILHIGYQVMRQAAHDLMDGSVPHDFVQEVTALAESVEHVEHVHEIRARRSGQYMIIDLKLDMDPNMTVKDSHAVATEVKRLIFDRYHHVGDVMIHINPHDEEHEDLVRL